MDKLLSIIVPSYNMEKYLPKCLGSLVVDDADMLNRLDVIVVNDGSKDRTSEIAHEFESKYPGIFRVIDKANGNYGSCINAALPTAKGRFVKILDADDTYDTAAFGRYLKELANLPPTTDMVMNDWVQVDEKGGVTNSTTYPLPTDVLFGVGECVKHVRWMAMHAVAFRTSLLGEIGYVQTEGISYTDLEWVYLPVAFAREIRYVKQFVYRHWVGRSGQTVERKTVIKNRWMQDEILDRMLKQYDEVTCSQGTRAYLQYQLRGMFAACFNRHTIDACGSQLYDYLENVRQKILTYEFLAEQIRSLAIFARTPFRFHYAVFVLRYPSFARPVLLFVRGYVRLRFKR